MSLFTRASMDEALLYKIHAHLGECTSVPIGNLMEMLKFCVQKKISQLEFDIYQQEESLPMSSLFSPVMANIYMKYSEKIALGTAPLKPTVWLRYFDNTSIL